MYKFLKLIIIAFALSLQAGCVTTTVRGFTDNSYKNFKIRKIMVRAPNSNFAFAELLEQSVIDELKNKKVSSESFIRTFPPTRKWTNDKVSKWLIDNSYDTIMYVILAGSESSSSNIGYIQTGSATVYGNNTSISGASVAINRFDRTTLTRIKIYDVKTANVIWIGDANTQAGGLAFMGDQTQTDSIAENVVEALQNSGHI